MEFLLKEWQETWIPKLKPRAISLDVLPKNIRKIITFSGIRRCGKTYIMFQLIEELAKKYPKECIFYINFEDERIEKKTENLTKLIPALIKLYGEKEYFLFLDEIQVMPEWSQWLRRIYDHYHNITLFVSGSSSKISSKEIPTELRGRALNHEVFPLSFKEFLSFKGIRIDDSLEYQERKLSIVKGLLDEYLTLGGFPEVALEESLPNKRADIQEYFKTIVLRDIIERNRVKKSLLLDDFLRLILNTKIFSVNKTYNILKSQGKTVGKETLLKYARYCEDAYFCFFMPIFSYKIKNQMQYPKKVYFSDNGFISALSLKFTKDLGALYENTVFLELKRKIQYNNKGIYYWKSAQQEEVDFAIKDGFEVKKLIQVCSDIHDTRTKEREVRALLKGRKELKCKDLLIITDDYEGEKEANWHGIHSKIIYIPLWKWLLNN